MRRGGWSVAALAGGRLGLVAGAVGQQPALAAAAPLINTCPPNQTHHPQAAASLPPGSVAGLSLLNSSGAMNNKGVVSDWRIILALPLFWLIDLLLSVRPVARALFDNVRDRETLGKVLQGVYR